MQHYACKNETGPRHVERLVIGVHKRYCNVYGLKLEFLDRQLEPTDELGADQHAPLQHEILKARRLGKAVRKTILTTFLERFSFDALVEPGNFLETDIRGAFIKIQQGFVFDIEIDAKMKTYWKIPASRLIRTIISHANLYLKIMLR